MKKLYFLLAFLIPSICNSTQQTLDGMPSTWYLMPNVMGGHGYVANNLTIDAAGEMVAYIGQVYMSGGSGSSKVCSTAGPCTISFMTGAVTWAAAGTQLDVGLQDVSTATGPPYQPDETFDVSGSWVQGTDNLNATTWTTFNMETGTKTLSHGDAVAIVMNLSVRNGADSVAIRQSAASAAPHRPGVSHKTASWARQIAYPNAIITFDDGTKAWIDGSLNATTYGTTAFNSGSTPDERCTVFQVNGPVKVDALGGFILPAGGTSDFDLVLYSDPTGTPSAMATVSLDGNAIESAASRMVHATLATAQSLSKDTDYAVCLKPTTANNVTLTELTVNNNADLASYSGGISAYLGTRSDGSGALSTTNTIRPLLGVRISSIDDAVGASAGGKWLGF